MSFADSRQRLELLIERVLEETEAFEGPLGSTHVTSMEKIAKTLEILEKAQDRSGKSNPNAEAKTEDLEEEFD